MSGKQGWKHVPSTVIIGPHGPCVTRGYMEIGPMRIYDDQVVVGPRGQHRISEGWTEFLPAPPEARHD